MGKFNLDDAESLEEAIGLSLGRASVCWEPKPEGVFDSGNAVIVLDELRRWVNDHYTKNPPKILWEFPNVPNGGLLR